MPNNQPNQPGNNPGQSSPGHPSYEPKKEANPGRESSPSDQPNKRGDEWKTPSDR